MTDQKTMSMGVVAHHPRAKTVFRLTADDLSINLGGEGYTHVSLILTYDRWREIVRNVDQAIATLGEESGSAVVVEKATGQCDRHGGKWGDDQTCPQCTDVNGVAL